MIWVLLSRLRLETLKHLSELLTFRINFQSLSSVLISFSAGTTNVYLNIIKPVWIPNKNGGNVFVKPDESETRIARCKKRNSRTWAHRCHLDSLYRTTEIVLYSENERLRFRRAERDSRERTEHGLIREKLNMNLTLLILSQLLGPASLKAAAPGARAPMAPSMRCGDMVHGW